MHDQEAELHPEPVAGVLDGVAVEDVVEPHGQLVGLRVGQGDPDRVCRRDGGDHDPVPGDCAPVLAVEVGDQDGVAVDAAHPHRSPVDHHHPRQPGHIRLDHPVDEPEVGVRGRRVEAVAAQRLRRLRCCCLPGSIGCGGVGCGRGRGGHGQLRVGRDVLQHPDAALVRATVANDDHSHGRSGAGLDPGHAAGDRAGPGGLSDPAVDADGGVAGVRLDEGDPLPERVRGKRRVAVGQPLQRLPRPPGVELEGRAPAAGDRGEPHPLLTGVQAVVSVGPAVQPQKGVDRAAAGSARVGDVGDHVGPGRQGGHPDPLGCVRCGRVLLGVRCRFGG